MKTTYHRLMVIVWVCAIGWIFLGNIINFHQHRILGKQLIPVALVNNRAKEQDLLKAFGKVGYTPGYFSSMPLSASAISNYSFIDTGKSVSLSFQGPDLLRTLLQPDEHPLRAPPFFIG